LGSQLTEPAPVTFLPYLGGERTPHNNPSARGAFIGLAHEHDTNTLTQAILEGVAYAFRDSQEALKQAGTDFESAFAVGGGAQSEVWLKIIATVLNKPLKIPEGGETGAAFGAARLGMCAKEGVNPVEICQAPKVDKVIEPNMQLIEKYEEGYVRYRGLYPKLK
jgi:xylulokinase